MALEAMTQSSDSKNLVAIKPRKERKYSITPLGQKWLEWDRKQQDKNNQARIVQEQPGQFIDQAEKARGIDTAWMDEV